MNKQELYAQLPRIIRRLFSLGLLAATVFLLIWYLAGGYNFWGHFLTVILFPFNIDYVAGSTKSAVLVVDVQLGGKTLQPSYFINQLNSNMVMLVTLLATWIRGDWRPFLKLCGWCLVFLLMYQAFSVLLQFQYARVGPQMADSAGVFWEETTWYLILSKLASFDKMLLRYFMWIPIFLGALSMLFFTSGPKKTRLRRK